MDASFSPAGAAASRVGKLSSKPPPLSSSSSSSSATAATATKSVAAEKKKKKKPKKKSKRRPVISSSAAATTTTAVAASSKKKGPPLLSEEEEEEEVVVPPGFPPGYQLLHGEDVVVPPGYQLFQGRLWAEDEEPYDDFPYYDDEKHEREVMEKALEEEFQVVFDSLRRWNDVTTYGIRVPQPQPKPKEIPSDDEYDFKCWKFERKVPLPKPPSEPVRSFADLWNLNQEDEYYLGDSIFRKRCEFKPKEEYAYSDDGSKDFDQDETTLSQIEPGPFPSSDSWSSQSPHGKPSLSSNKPHEKPSLSLNSVGSLNGDIKEDERE